ncbi:MAG TPA: UDP-glucose 4-epimerase GalE [Chitinophagales bacterium]|jgi:UDP-glucose 4-epimerase|nr:UDP-glucose 4-epimerase GalE [Chitinophagales bacterium]MBP6154548.1 UDP-glucose 4-epimerase GalE [Chitinophagales bacterium]HQV77761.1 UDP-glucose 4-epimerase GalE [Chitinophagales bacterium]HQW78235.1 UDP-glucose 4-epimerase GalE [Chitinophagales bacterium]HRB66548.1 UDP-glucose 4-epimerase GalE [Chitinophagales bacterium]
MKVIVTGGAGYIGSHTIVDLLNHGYEVVCIDNLYRSKDYSLNAIEQITHQKINFYKIDLCNQKEVNEVFKAHHDAIGVIHFAALKSVPESVENPLQYYSNNLESLLNVLHAINEVEIPNFVFSSSCSVYGNAETLPVTEQTPLKVAESPYAHTKQIGEEIIRNFSISNKKHASILLRYFNPIGAHPSGLIGEVPLDKPNNLVPFITQTAIGKLPQLTVFGSDYDTRDGSNIRDYIHVSDIAHAHTLALQYLIENKNTSNIDIFNLGTGNGVSVLEAIQAFEKVTSLKLNYKIGPRRAGDVVAVYADNSKAKSLLNWTCKFSLEDAMLHAWNWELKMKELAW